MFAQIAMNYESLIMQPVTIQSLVNFHSTTTLESSTPANIKSMNKLEANRDATVGLHTDLTRTLKRK